MSRPTSAGGATQAPAPRVAGGARVALALLATSQFLLILDAGIVNVALPSIERDLGFAPQDLSWVVNGYVLTFGGLLLLGGRLADLAGRRRLFIIGVALFAAASLAGALAPAATWLVAARAVQGAGAALAAPAALALLMTLFGEGPQRARALAVFGVVAGLGGASGSLLGGVLTELVGWRAVLWINVPIGAAMIALAPRSLPDGRGPDRDRDRGGRFDLVGAVTVTAGLGLLVYAFVQAAEAGWASPATLALVGMSAVLLAGFVVIEWRAANPMLPLGLFRLRLLRGANVVMAFLTMAIMPMFFLLSVYLQRVYGWGPVGTGLGFLPIVATMIAFNRVAPAVVARLGLRTTLAVGLFVSGVGLAWLSRLAGPEGNYLTDLLAPGVVTGVGFGLAFVAAMVAATTGAPESLSGLAAGLVNTSQQVGTALGIAALVSLSAAQAAAHAAGGATYPAALTGGLSVALLAAAGIAAAGGVLAVLLIPART